MFKQLLQKIRTMNKQALTAFGTCGLFLLLALVQLLILAVSPLGRSWDHILLMLVDIAIAAIACVIGIRWQNNSAGTHPHTQQPQQVKKAQRTRPAQQPQQPQRRRPAQQPQQAQRTRPAQQPQQAQRTRPAQQPQQAQRTRPAQQPSTVSNTLGSESLPLPSATSKPQSNPFDEMDWDDEF